MIWPWVFICWRAGSRGESIALTMPWLGLKSDRGGSARRGPEHGHDEQRRRRDHDQRARETVIQPEQEQQHTAGQDQIEMRVRRCEREVLLDAHHDAGKHPGR